MRISLPRMPIEWQRQLLFSGHRDGLDDVSSASPSVLAALENVGPRLQALRTRRGLSLAQVAANTGISKSTLSRLETGQRRPSLELLLPLAQTYRVALDEMVGAPESGDPRIRLRPRRIAGRTVVPLTRHEGDAHTWKILVPRSHRTPEPKAHPGMSWIYVLSGPLRLIIGEREVLMETGEVAEFDTSTPHWFGSDGVHDAEILAIFGPHSEPAHSRAARAASACVNTHAET